MKLATLAGAMTVVCLLPSVAHAGPALDDILNNPVVDQRSPANGETSEGLVLIAQKKAQFITLSKEQSLGQTFVTGPNAERLWRVSVGLCFWPDSWQKGEEVTFALYDGPQKSRKLYSRTLDYDHAWFKWDVPFDVNLPVKPNQKLYWEVTHNGGADNSIRVVYLNENAYPDGQAWVAGKSEPYDLYFVSMIKNRPDRRANMKRFLDTFDYSRPELAAAGQAYHAGELEKARSLILQAFQKRLQNADWFSHREPGDKVDTALMDKLVAENRLYSDSSERQGEWIPMDRTTTWREVWHGSSDYVRQNDLFNDLGNAYGATHDEKYARKLNELMLDFMNDQPSPFDGGMRGGHWVAMFVAWRLGDAWSGFANALSSKSLTDDTRLAWIYYWSRMAQFSMREPSGGNHANAVGEAMMSFGHRFPLYKDARTWQDFGFQKLVSNSLELFLPDGACKEPAMNYHGFSLANLLSGLDQAKKYGYSIPKSILDTTERALSYTAYMLMPNGIIPTNGDTDAPVFMPGDKPWDGWLTQEARKGWTMFGRQDLHYIATQGKEGTRPTHNSTIFPDMGHYILRSGWGGEGGKDYDQARWLLLQGHNFGSHGHWDMNNVTMYAYGRLLLMDPGRTKYGTPLMYQLTENTSHNVLLVDDEKMNRRPPQRNAFAETDVADYVDNSYMDLYPGVDHTRAVVFVRPGYYVVFDTADGKAPHRYGLNWWLTSPGHVSVDEAAGRVVTDMPGGANLLMLTPDTEGLKIALRHGTIDAGGKIRDDIPVVTFQHTGQAFGLFTTLLYPIPAGSPAPKVRVSAVRFGPDRTTRICTVDTPGGVDVITYVSGHGASVVRLDPSGSVRSVAVFGLKAAGQGASTAVAGEIISSGAPISMLSAVYEPDTLVITSEDSDASIRIATLGRKKALVNGTAKAVSMDPFQPFAP